MEKTQQIVQAERDTEQRFWQRTQVIIAVISAILALCGVIGYQMVRQSLVEERITQLQASRDHSEAAVQALQHDVTEMHSDIKWIVRKLSK